jgi:hypothetical protein
MMRTLIVATMLICAAAHARDATNPQISRYESADWCWQVSVTSNLPQPSPTGTAGSLLKRPRAVLYDAPPLGLRTKVAQWDLVTDAVPASALVANDGTFVTIHDVQSPGHGDAVVIYWPDGSVVRTLALDDLLLDSDIARLVRKGTSIQWSGAHRIDDEKRVLIIQIPGAKKGQIAEIPVSLATGELLAAKRALFAAR